MHVYIIHIPVIYMHNAHVCVHVHTYTYAYTYTYTYQGLTLCHTLGMKCGKRDPVLWD